MLKNDISDNSNIVNINDDADWASFMNSIEDESDNLDESDFKYESFKSNNNIKINLEKSIDITNTNTCSNCNISYKQLNGIIYCDLCGDENKLEIDSCSYRSESGNNVNSNSFMSFNFIGKNSYNYQRSYLKTCANYSSFRKNNNRKDMYKYNYNYEGSKLPKNVIKLAIELFSKIKEKKYVYRGNGKKGIIGACLFYACVMNNITKTPREISNILNIEERFLSQGDRTIQELNEKGVVKIPTTLRPLNDYLKQYFSILKIDVKYMAFIIDIINMVDKKNIHIVNDSRTTTKAVGAIYLLINRIKEYKNITKDTIVKEYKISKSTFIRYYNLLNKNYKMLKPIFKKHKISMPIKWKD